MALLCQEGAGALEGSPSPYRLLCTCLLFMVTPPTHK